MVFSEEDKVMSDTKVCLHLFFCFFGLLGSYLTWGLLQEKIMTKRYGEQDQGQYFSDSQFLVFVNRILAVWVAAIYLWLRPQPIHRAPMYKYSYCSFSNIMSSWCQYEALKYISFPTQVRASSSTGFFKYLPPGYFAILCLIKNITWISWYNNVRFETINHTLKSLIIFCALT